MVREHYSWKGWSKNPNLDYTLPTINDVHGISGVLNLQSLLQTLIRKDLQVYCGLENPLGCCWQINWLKVNLEYFDIKEICNALILEVMYFKLKFKIL